MSSHIRILHIVSSMECGGIQAFLMNLYRNIDRAKVQFDFLVHTDVEGYFDKEIGMLGGKIYRIPRYSICQFYNQLRTYDQFFLEHPEYRIVHSHINFCNLGVLRAAWKAKISTRISHLHSIAKTGMESSLSSRIKRMAFPLISRYATHMFACSSIVAKAYGKKSDNCLVVKNGIQTERFCFNRNVREKVRRKLNWLDACVLVNVGRLSEPKNHFFLIDVFNEILKYKQNTILALVGDGTLRQQIVNKVKDLGIENSVCFLGNRDDIPDLLCAADMFVSTSVREGFPVALVEAQSSGIPIVSSDVVPQEVQVTDLVRFLSLKETSNQWAQIVLAEEEKKRNLRESYAQIVKEAGFDIRQTVQQLTDLYINEYEQTTFEQRR